MGLKEDLENQLIDVQERLAFLNAAPEDTYPFGTIAVFAASNNTKWFYVKTGEEQWVRLHTSTNLTGSITMQLSEWLLKAKQSSIGYFEVYIMNTEETPIFASS